MHFKIFQNIVGKRGTAQKELCLIVGKGGTAQKELCLIVGKGGTAQKELCLFFTFLLKIVSSNTPKSFVSWRVVFGSINI